MVVGEAVRLLCGVEVFQGPEHVDELALLRVHRTATLIHLVAECFVLVRRQLVCELDATDLVDETPHEVHVLGVARLRCRTAGLRPTSAWCGDLVVPSLADELLPVLEVLLEHLVDRHSTNPGAVDAPDRGPGHIDGPALLAGLVGCFNHEFRLRKAADGHLHPLLRPLGGHHPNLVLPAGGLPD